MGLRDRRENRRREKSEFGAGGSAATYQLRAKLVSFGDDYWIENAGGERVLRVDGKVLRVRKTLDIEDTQGHAPVPHPDEGDAHSRHDGHREPGRRRDGEGAQGVDHAAP